MEEEPQGQEDFDPQAYLNQIRGALREGEISLHGYAKQWVKKENKLLKTKVKERTLQALAAISLGVADEAYLEDSQHYAGTVADKAAQLGKASERAERKGAVSSNLFELDEEEGDEKYQAVINVFIADFAEIIDTLENAGESFRGYPANYVDKHPVLYQSSEMLEAIFDNYSESVEPKVLRYVATRNPRTLESDLESYTQQVSDLDEKSEVSSDVVRHAVLNYRDPEQFIEDYQNRLEELKAEYGDSDEIQAILKDAAKYHPNNWKDHVERQLQKREESSS